MAYELTKAVTLGDLKTTSQKINAKLLKSAKIENNVLSFYTTADKTGTAAFSLNVPEEYFLDQLKTQFLPSFTFAAETYPGATDPNLNNKPVLVLAVKGDQSANVTYSFVNMEKLVDEYKIKAGDSAKILNIDGYEIEFKVSAADGNSIEVKDDGLYVASPKVTGGVKDNLVILGTSGAFADSGIKVGDVITTADFATTAEVTEMLNEVFGADDSGDENEDENGSGE